MSKVSISSQCSTLLPPAMRLMSIAVTVTCLPVGGMPINAPFGGWRTLTRGILGANTKRTDDHYQPWVSFPQCAFPLSRSTRICTWREYFVVRLPWAWRECADSDNMRQRGGERSGGCCGFSMGAAVAILLPPHSAVAGIIADSPYAHYHYSLQARPDRMIGDHSVRQTLRRAGTMSPPILLIHAKDDPMVAHHHARRLVVAARTAGRSIQEYYTPCDIHCGSYGYDPLRYMALLQEFVAL